MFDRLFMPALTFTLLVASLAAFASDMVSNRPAAPSVVQLERVVIVAPRDMAATPVAQAEVAPAAAVVR